MSIEVKSTRDLLIEEQERVVKLDTIKKSLENEVRTLHIRIEEVEANALAGGKRVIAKLESRIRDVEIEVEEEKRRHAETEKFLRKKEHRVKELCIQSEEDHKTITLLQENCDKLNEKVKVYKRNVQEQVRHPLLHYIRTTISKFAKLSLINICWIGGSELSESAESSSIPTRIGSGRRSCRSGRK